jgi:hypothetical protein
MRESEEEKALYAYEVFPINFNMLPIEKQGEVVDRFKGFLNGLSKELRTHVVKSKKTVDLGGGESFETTYYRFFMESYGAPIDHLLTYMNLKYQRVTEVPTVEPVKAFARWMALPGGQLMKAYTIYALPGSLIEGFITETYGVAERVLICVEPLRPEQAAKRMGKYMRLMKGLVLADQSKGRSAPEEVALKVSRAQEAYDKLLAGASRLFELKVNICMAGKDRAELRRSERKLKETLQARLVRIDSPSYLQPEMMMGAEGKRLVMDTDTAACFFPFISEDVIETPGGVFLGINDITGAPVIYDPLLRMNQNIIIVGKPGAGKSFLSKILFTRLAKRYRNLAFFIIDPENEYGHVGELLGGQVVGIQPNKLLGLDPVQIFAGSKDSAAAILADIAKLPEELYSDLRTAVGVSGSIFEAFEHATPELKRCLRSLVDGADRFLVAGDPLPFTRRMVFNLSPLHREFQLSPERSMTLQAASILVFSKIWQMLDNPQFIPLQDPKLVIVDEVWMYVSMPAAARFLEGVSRRGRKRNIIFINNTQRASDVLEGAGGRALVENCATKVLMRQDESAIKLVGEAFGLSNYEKDATLEFKPGQGILVAENIHIPVDFLAGKDEYAIFTTRPAERLRY